MNSKRYSNSLFTEYPLIMGILNITPDSFSDGGRLTTQEKIIESAEQMILEGANILDIGGESTRPGALAISENEELDRVIPALIKIRETFPDIIISVDTRRSKVAESALLNGANIINDVSGLQFDRKILLVVKQYNAGLILMHTRGSPETMQTQVEYTDLNKEIVIFLQNLINECTQIGIEKQALIIDPGLGFAKTAHQNWEILRHLNDYACEFSGIPLLIGHSRKSFLGELIKEPIPSQRDFATALCSGLIATSCVPLIFRVHNVKLTQQSIMIAKEWGTKKRIDNNEFI